MKDFELILSESLTSKEFIQAATAVLNIFLNKKFVYLPGDAQILQLNRTSPCIRSALPMPDDCIFYTHHEGC